MSKGSGGFPAYTSEEPTPRASAWADRVVIYAQALFTQAEVLDHLKAVLDSGRAAFPGGTFSAILDFRDEVERMLPEFEQRVGHPASCRDVERFLIPLIRANPEKAAALVANYLRTDHSP